MSAQYSLPITLSTASVSTATSKGCVAACSTPSGRRRARVAAPASSASASAATAPAATSSPRNNCCALVDDTNPVPELAALEARILDEANHLDIGPMGFGGKLTVGSCKIGALQPSAGVLLRQRRLHVLGLSPPRRRPRHRGRGRRLAVPDSRRVRPRSAAGGRPARSRRQPARRRSRCTRR